MANQRWTPGAWGEMAMDVVSNRGVCLATASYATVSAEEARANARLMAAAPELYEALVPFANVAGDSGLRASLLGAVRPHERESLSRALDSARAALDAARGER